MAGDSRQSSEPDAAPSQPDADRLDSWKEIAAFLRRDVRTVQRWEKQAGLPIHRHPQSRLRTAYAYRSEIEAWWRAQGDTLDAAATSRTVSTSAWGFNSRAAALLVVAVAGSVGTALFYARARSAAPTVQPARPPVTVLLTTLENETGDRTLGALVNETVARELSLRPGVEVAAPSRVSRAVRLMRLDPAAPVTRATGRDLCLRDGQIRFVVAGRVHKLQARYFVDLELIESADGRVRASLERGGARVGDLLAGVRDEAGRLGAAVLEAARTPAPPLEPLEPVTTASMTAARLYTAAVQAGARRQWAAAELLARRAAAADERFAAAHALIAWAVRQNGRPAAESLAHAERAVSLCGGASEQEICLITGTRNELAGDLAGALAAYEALHRLQPRDVRALTRLIDGYSRAGRFKDAVRYSVTRADIVPADFYANVSAARALTVWQADRDAAQPYVTRSTALATSDAVSERPFWGAWLKILPVFARWLDDDTTAAVETLARLQPDLDRRIGRERDGFATGIGFAHLTLGRLGHAERAFRSASAPVRQTNLALLALSVGDEKRALAALRQIRAHARERPALFARVGLLREAEDGLAASFGSEHAEGIAQVTRGLIAARRGQTDAAIAALRQGVDLLRFSGEPEYFLAVEALARIWSMRGDSVTLLTEAGQQRARTCGSARWAGAYWLKLNVSLLAEYRRLGREADAERLLKSLQSALRHADRDHPFLRIVTGGQRSPSVTTGAAPSRPGPAAAG